MNGRIRLAVAVTGIFVLSAGLASTQPDLVVTNISATVAGDIRLIILQPDGTALADSDVFIDYRFADSGSPSDTIRRDSFFQVNLFLRMGLIRVGSHADYAVKFCFRLNDCPYSDA